MKKLGFAFVAILCVSCGQPASVVGTWRLNSVTMDDTQIPLDDCKKKSIVIFQEDGKAKIHSFYEMPENKECKEIISQKEYTISGNIIKSVDENKRKDEEKYSIKGDTLFLEKTFISQGKNVIVTTKLIKE
ncbi:MAG: lipocalin family protein [Capnocytophaga sp.]|nr:lipocalin family protein [Capnocytophaga sp.]